MFSRCTKCAFTQTRTSLFTLKYFGLSIFLLLIVKSLWAPTPLQALPPQLPSPPHFPDIPQRFRKVPSSTQKQRSSRQQKSPQTRSSSQKKTTSKNSPQEAFLKRWKHIQALLNKKQVQTAAVPSKLLVLLDEPVFGFSGIRNARIFSLKVTFLNNTAKPLTLQQNQVTLKADAQTYFPAENEKELATYHHRETFLKKEWKKPFKKLTLPPHKPVTVYLNFPGLPRANVVPQMTLSFDVPGEALSINVNEWFRALLKLETFSLGPYKTVTVFRIHGEVNNVNVASLTETAERL